MDIQTERHLREWIKRNVADMDEWDEVLSRIIQFVEGYDDKEWLLRQDWTRIDELSRSESL